MKVREKQKAQERQKAQGKRKSYIPPGVLRRVILIFGALYVGSMGLATALVQQKFRQDHMDALNKIGEWITNYVSDTFQADENGQIHVTRENAGNILNFELAACTRQGELPYMLWSGAAWDGDGEKIAESGPVFVGYAADSEKEGEAELRTTRIDQYLTEEELDQLSGYYFLNLQESKYQYSDEWTEYSISPKLASDGELASISVSRTEYQSLTPEEAESWIGTVSMIQKEGEEEHMFGRMDPEEIWVWSNPRVSEDEAAEAVDEYGFSKVFFMVSGGYFPGQDSEVNCWPEWRQDEYLNSFPDRIRETAEFWNGENGSLSYTGAGQDLENDVPETEADLTIPVYFYNTDSDSEETVCTLKLRMTSHSWLAAMDYMRYVYLGGTLLMLACVTYVLWVLNKSYRKAAETEMQRRDFTNAMAHEMKTPLSVIRGFAENLKENPDTGKREYYLDHIIGQTEEMDGTVKEMIQVSRLDSGNLQMSREKSSLSQLLETEVERLESRAEERNIDVCLRCSDEITIEGDRNMLEKAFRCLLDNAVSYNRRGGWIYITVDSGTCVIENTGDPIPKEDLSRVGEMLWTGKRERGADAYGEKHLGMGLYLAGRIFRMHGMELKVENTEKGVKVSVNW